MFSLFAVALITLTLILWFVFWVFCVQWDRRAYVSGCYKCQSLLFYTLRIFSRLIPVLVYFCLFLEVWFPLSLSFVFYSFTLTYINIYQGAGIHIIAHWRSEGSFQGLTLSFHHKSTGGQIQIIMPTQGPLPTEPSHCPRFIILKTVHLGIFIFVVFFFES